MTPPSRPVGGGVQRIRKISAAEMFARCRDRQAWSEDAACEGEIVLEIGRALRAGGLGWMRADEAAASCEILMPEPMGNGEPDPPRDTVWL